MCAILDLGIRHRWREKCKLLSGINPVENSFSKEGRHDVFFQVSTFRDSSRDPWTHAAVDC